MKGLTSSEVNDRKAKGLVNDAEIRTSRTYTDIFVKNAFTPFNIILFILGILLIICDELVSAVSATGIIIVNILISTIQEMRAKRKLDRISLLVRPKVTAVRDGVETVIDQSEIVMDDLIVMRAGEQAIVDGVAERCRSVEMDESLLTGESSTVRKHEGDRIYSGSVCVTGEAYYRVTAVGSDNYASKMLSSAREFTSKKTPLQMETGTMTKILMLIAAILFVITIFKSIFLTHESFGETLEAFVLCLDVVPIALFLLITLTYMIAAMRMADSGVLLQQSNSVESISHVDTVCMDKTGTITTNKLRYEDSIDLIPSEECRPSSTTTGRPTPPSSTRSSSPPRGSTAPSGQWTAGGSTRSTSVPGPPSRTTAVRTSTSMASYPRSPPRVTGPSSSASAGTDPCTPPEGTH